MINFLASPPLASLASAFDEYVDECALVTCFLMMFADASNSFGYSSAPE